jgi:hypothetical protein
MKFGNNKKSCIHLEGDNDDTTMEEVGTTKFFGLQIDSKFRWKECSKYRGVLYLPSSPCFAMRQSNQLGKHILKN